MFCFSGSKLFGIEAKIRNKLLKCIAYLLLLSLLIISIQFCFGNDITRFLHIMFPLNDKKKS